LPQIGRRYLLFLKYDPNAQDYGLMTGYQLEESQVYRLDERKFEVGNHQRLEHPLREEGKSENEFLAHAN
jgi:hypothetical protein